MRQPGFILIAGLLAGHFAGCGARPAEKLVPLETVPAKVLETAREKLPDVEFHQALKRDADRYEVRGTDKRGKVRNINLTAAGEVLEIE